MTTVFAGTCIKGYLLGRGPETETQMTSTRSDGVNPTPGNDTLIAQLRDTVGRRHCLTGNKQTERVRKSRRSGERDALCEAGDFDDADVEGTNCFNPGIGKMSRGKHYT